MSELPDPTCIDCVAFGGETRDELGVVLGRCRFRPELGQISEKFPYCASFQVRRERADRVRIPKQAKQPSPNRRRSAVPSQRPAAFRTLDNPTTGDTDGEISMDRNGLKQVLREILAEETMYGYPTMGSKWEQGTLVLRPADENLQAKELPLEKFFQKVVMVRDRLRVLEAKINASDKLSGTEKVELQSYVSKIYGSLTSFNVLFADKADHFSSKNS